MAAAVAAAWRHTALPLQQNASRPFPISPPALARRLPSDPPARPLPETRVRRALSTKPTDAFYGNSALDELAATKTTKVSLKELVDFGKGRMSEVKLITSANFVRREIAIRLAHRLADFQRLPFIVGTAPLLHDVYQLYWNSFNVLRQYPEIKSLKANEEFCRVLISQLNAHRVVLPKLAAGLKMCEEQQQITPEMHTEFFDRILRSRLSRRLLAQQHVALSMPEHASERMVGVIGTNLSAVDLLEGCIRRAREMCRHTYGVAPRVTVDGRLDATLAGVPEHIEYVLYELLKNALRAVAERAGYKMRPYKIVQQAIRASKEGIGSIDARPVAPPTWQHHEEERKLSEVIVTIAQSDRDLSYRVSDQGGGIAAAHVPQRAALPQLFHYSFTTAPPVDFAQVTPMLPNTLDEYDVLPMAGLGCGLPIANIYAAFFGGRLELETMYGYGTDVYYRLKRTADDQLEHLI